MLTLAALLLLSLFGCGKNPEQGSGQSSEQSSEQGSEQSSGQSSENAEQTPGQNPVATLTLATGEQIVMELYPDVAPQSVYNFIYLANTEHFYDGLIFHRVIPEFMIQGGSLNGDGTGDIGYTIKGEFAENGVTNDLSHALGVVSMARRKLPLDSASSQFFICVADCSPLDGSYAAFGKVTQGLDYAVAISKVATDGADKPLEDVVIESIRVDTFGVAYPEPTRITQ